jgi:predicted SnoaL-like aldol condensation-catalyzing enzyme
MTEQELNKAVVTRFNREVLEQSDFSAYQEIVSPDFINHTAPQVLTMVSRLLLIL